MKRASASFPSGVGAFEPKFKILRERGHPCQNVDTVRQVVNPHFGEIRSDAQPRLMARWKACGRLSIRFNWTFFAICYLRFRSYEAKSVQLGCFRRGSTSLYSNFTWTRLSPINHSWHQKTRDIELPKMKTASFCVPSFWHNTGVWRTNGRTDGRICCSITALAKLSLTRCNNPSSPTDSIWVMIVWNIH